MIPSREGTVKELSGLRLQQVGLLSQGMFLQRPETKLPENFMPDEHSL
jgi:hypothetical protein